MTAAELLDDLNRAGATLELVDGKLRLRGVQISGDFKQLLRANRVELLKELERRPAEDRQRYGQVPPPAAPITAKELIVPEPWKHQLIAHVLRQPRPVHAWVTARANKYFEHGVKTEDCEWRACVDVIAWQRMTGGLEAAKFVVDLPSNEELGLQANRRKNNQTDERD
jgi:hypothetical protein